jgi:cold shock CspA family protein
MTYQGSITLFNQPKGWGFITRDDGEKVFFHVANKISSFLPALSARVEFEMAPGLEVGKSDQAVNLRDVRPVGGAL